MKPRLMTAMVILLAAILVGAAFGLCGCGASPAEEGVTDDEAADIVREYIATTAADHLRGITIADLQVTIANGQRTLHLDLVADSSNAAEASLAGLCFGGTSEDGWPGDLSRDWGLELLWVDIYTTYPDGITEHTLIDVAGHGFSTEGGAPRWRGGPVTTAPAAPSFAEAWAASQAALDALGPTRVSIVETTEGRLTGEGIPPEESDVGPQTQQAEQLIDVAAGRARLTVNASDHRVKTTVVQGRERTSTTSQQFTQSSIVSVDRYISLRAPEGLPLPLWAGTAVGPTEGYADLFKGDVNDPGPTPADTTVQPQNGGGIRISWHHDNHGVASTLDLVLGSDYLPIRIELAGEGTPDSGDLQGLALEYRTTIEYGYEPVASFTDADFALDIPDDAFWGGVSYELALDRPWSEQADWGQYWLGSQVEEWSLTRAEHAIYGANPDAAAGAGAGTAPGTEQRDEGIFLMYDRPEATSPNESIQVTVRPLRGRYHEDSLTFAEQRVAAGDWTRREMTLAGRPATVYSGALEGGADDRIDSIDVYLSDAFVEIQVWAPVDPLLVLEALTPVQ